MVGESASRDAEDLCRIVAERDLTLVRMQRLSVQGQLEFQHIGKERNGVGAVGSEVRHELIDLRSAGLGGWEACPFFAPCLEQAGFAEAQQQQPDREREHPRQLSSARRHHDVAP